MFEWEMVPKGTSVWIFGPQLMELFVEVMEPLDNVDLVEEVHH